jgi:hypothetical protein
MDCCWLLVGPQFAVCTCELRVPSEAILGMWHRLRKKSVGKLKDRVYSSLPTLFLVIGVRHYLFLNM